MNLSLLAAKQAAYAQRHPLDNPQKARPMPSYAFVLRGGLRVGLFIRNEQWSLCLTRKGDGPSLTEQKTCRAFYAVAADATEKRVQKDGVTSIWYRWPVVIEVKQKEIAEQLDTIHAVGAD